MLAVASRLSSNTTKHSVRALVSFQDVLTEQLASIEKAGTYKRERVITSKQGTSISVQGQKQEVLNFCANNYLGLSSHPEVIKAAKEALDSHGFGLSSVRFICGTQDIHKQLEKAISRFHGTEDTILYPSCFDANGGFFEAVLSAEDAVISDKLNHASIIDGIRLCKAERHQYQHLDLADLEAKLIETQKNRLRLIVTDGVFSMDGDVAPLKEICDLADKYNAKVFIDECHATGFFGPTGRGSDEQTGTTGRIFVINSTLGKAMGGATGGYTTGPRYVIDLLRQRARPYLFSNTLAPSVAGASLKVLEMLERSTEFPKLIQRNTHHFRRRMTEAKFKILGNKDHPIVPVMVGDARLASELADDLLQKGIYVIGFSYPVVPVGQARIRVQISAAHTIEQIDRAVDAFIECGRKRGLIAPSSRL